MCQQADLEGKVLSLLALIDVVHISHVLAKRVHALVNATAVLTLHLGLPLSVLGFHVSGQT